jgi:NAD(P)-dependent dehydrogenase (short-subunit alcohol dehydrogenase family)
MLDLAGKIGIVTGGIRRAGWGNGKAIAVLLARRGEVGIVPDPDIPESSSGVS